MTDSAAIVNRAGPRDHDAFDSVILGFYYGRELPDPDGLLGPGGRQVSGKLSMRSLKLAALSDVSRPQVLALVEAPVIQIR